MIEGTLTLAVLPSGDLIDKPILLGTAGAASVAAAAVVAAAGASSDFASDFASALAALAERLRSLKNTGRPTTKTPKKSRTGMNIGTPSTNSLLVRKSIPGTSPKTAGSMTSNVTSESSLSLDNCSILLDPEPASSSNVSLISFLFSVSGNNHSNSTS